MDGQTMRKFVTIHVREGAWQVVMLFRDELIRRDSRNIDEDTMSGDLKSRKLTWWPADEDQDLQVLCKVLTEGDSKLDSLDLSGCKLTDEGVKHIAEALCNIHCPLNSLQLKWCKVSNEGATHLAEVLKDSKYKLKWFSNLLIEVTAEGKEQVSEEGLS